MITKIEKIRLIKIIKTINLVFFNKNLSILKKNYFNIFLYFFEDKKFCFDFNLYKKNGY